MVKSIVGIVTLLTAAALTSGAVYLHNLEDQNPTVHCEGATYKVMPRQKFIDVEAYVYAHYNAEGDPYDITTTGAIEGIKGSTIVEKAHTSSWEDVELWPKGRIFGPFSGIQKFEVTGSATMRGTVYCDNKAWIKIVTDCSESGCNE